MKKILLPSLFIVLLLNCKKESDISKEVISPEEAFAKNEVLIDPKAKVYLIADVEGLESVTKINEQDIKTCAQAGYGGGSCSNGASHYSGDVGCPITGKDWNLSIDYYGMGETKENLINKAFTVLKTPKGESYGVRIAYRPFKGKDLLSNLVNNSAYSWSNIELMEMTPSGGTPPYYIKLRFNCELKELTGTRVIRLKNAITRVKI